MSNQTKNTIIRTNLLVILLSLLSIYLPSSFAQTASEIDIASGAGGSANAACVATNNCFTPNPFTVAPGTTVTWKNTDTAIHAICSGKPTDDECGKVFEDDSIKPGQTFQFTFQNSGTYNYYCSVHPWMTGQVIVGAGATVPTQSPTSSSTSTGPHAFYLSNATGSTPNTTGNTGGITVTTDKSSYNDGDVIKISGTVNNYISNTPVTIRIIDPIGNIVKVDQTDVGSDRTFSTSITATGALWQKGMQTVKVSYGSPDISAQTTFQFSGSANNGGYGGSTVTKSINATYSLQASDGQIYNVSYTISGGTVSSMKVVPSHGLRITLNTTSNGFITVSLPRTLIDSKGHSGQDNAFFIENASLLNESDDTNYRHLTIQLSQGSTQIGIQGTTVASNFRSYNPSAQSGSLLAPIIVTTDKQVYSHEDTIVITGHVANTTLGQGISMKITSPSGNVVTAGQISLDNYGDFYTEIATVGNLWFENGQYTLTVQQGDEQAKVNSTVFQLAGKGPILTPDQDNNPAPVTHVPIPSQNTTINTQPSSSNSAFTPTQQDIENINQAKNNQTIAAEVNVGNDKTTSIDNSVSVQTTSTTSDSFGVTVNASSQTGPKVIVFNINATTINVANLKDLGVTYDDKPISPAPNMDAILHAKPTDNPSFAIVVTQSGVQVLVLVPHFSEHTITITNMSKVIPSVPEFGPIVGVVTVVSIIASIMTSRRFQV